LPFSLKQLHQPHEVDVTDTEKCPVRGRRSCGVVLLHGEKANGKFAERQHVKIYRGQNYGETGRTA
jgi:hypothetical protein